MRRHKSKITQHAKKLKKTQLYQQITFVYKKGHVRIQKIYFGRGGGPDSIFDSSTYFTERHALRTSLVRERGGGVGLTRFSKETYMYIGTCDQVTFQGSAHEGVVFNLTNHKNIGFLSNTGPDPLRYHKATKTTFNVGPS